MDAIDKEVAATKDAVGVGGRLVSPNDLVDAASEQMLDGRKPESKEDWAVVVNFAAHNIVREAVAPACRLLAKIYDMPLTAAEVNEIVAFQLSRDGNDAA